MTPKTLLIDTVTHIVLASPEESIKQYNDSVPEWLHITVEDENEINDMFLEDGSTQEVQVH